MKIVVIVKEVADTEAVITLADGQPDLSNTAMVANPYDEFAVEEALKIKEAHGGEVRLESPWQAHGDGVKVFLLFPQSRAGEEARVR